MSLFSRIKEFRNNDKGVALVEFALLLPVMLILLIGTLELSNLLRLDRKVTLAANTAVDLTAQQPSLSDAELADIFRALELSLIPFGEGGLSVGIRSYEFDPDDGSASVAWTESLAGGVIDENMATINSLAVPGQSVVVATAQYVYQPIFPSFIFDSFTIDETAFSRPRNSLNIVRE